MEAMGDSYFISYYIRAYLILLSRSNLFLKFSIFMLEKSTSPDASSFTPSLFNFFNS